MNIDRIRKSFADSHKLIRPTAFCIVVPIVILITGGVFVGSIAVIVASVILAAMWRLHVIEFEKMVAARLASSRQLIASSAALRAEIAKVSRG